MAASQKLVQRVLKLKALAESDNPHEAEVAAARAMELMRAHAITAADLDAVARQAEDPLVEQPRYLDGLRMRRVEESGAWISRVAPWKRTLFFTVAEYFGLRSSYAPGTAIVRFYGHLSDVEAAARLYEVCARQIDRQALESIARASAAQQERLGFGFDRAEGRAHGRAFRASAVHGLEAKFDELTRESAQDHAQVHGLVLARRQKVNDWVDANYKISPGTGAGLLSGDLDEDGWSDEGYQAGQKLSLVADAEIEGAARKALAQENT